MDARAWVLPVLVIFGKKNSFLKNMNHLLQVLYVLPTLLVPAG
jgi:hypothetical protein